MSAAGFFLGVGWWEEVFFRLVREMLEVIGGGLKKGSIWLKVWGLQCLESAWRAAEVVNT